MDARFDGVMRLAFCLDGYRRQVGVEVRQDPGGTVHCGVLADTDMEVTRSHARSNASFLSTTTAWVPGRGRARSGHRTAARGGA
jgi:hypothetical protein